MIENFEEVKTYFETNKDSKDVKDYIKGFSNLDGVKSFLETNEDGKKYLNSYADGKVTKGIESYKTNNFNKDYDERYTKEHPSENPETLKWQKRVLELENENAASKKDLVRKEMLNNTLKQFQEAKLPPELVDFMLGETEEETTINTGILAKVFKTHVEALVAERLKGGYVPPVGAPAPGTKNPFKPGVDFNLTEQGKMYKENPELAKTLMANI